MAATAHAWAAREHAVDAAAQLKDIHDRLSETLSYLIGTDEDAIRLAAVHLISIRDEVGSATADQLAQSFVAIGEAIRQTPTAGLSEVIQAVGGYLGRIDGLRDSVEQLAAQLGA